MLLWKMAGMQVPAIGMRSFNPCSLGCCSERRRCRSSPARWCFVSILVLLDVALKGRRNTSWNPADFWVSILVLLDVALKDASRIGAKHSGGEFQSLFSWMLLWKPYTCKDYNNIYFCFNPCSLGCCSESLCKCPFLTPDHDCFNPCSLGCCSERLSKEIRRDNCNMFQSLFSWMLLWKRWARYWYGAWKGVSILVLLDVALKVDRFDRVKCLVWEFQSLFSWMLLWKTTTGFGERVERSSFNPCSLGCCSERVSARFRLRETARFQSLFSWMLLWKNIVIEGIVTYDEFQSLFSWMLLWKFPRQGHPGPILLFQSLFSWMLLWKHSRCDRMPDGRPVSILVLLDVALKGQGCGLALGQGGVSILVLLDVALKVDAMVEL